MRTKLLVVTLCAVHLLASDVDLNRLLLNPQRVRRLKRDRERQTDRWLAFAKRVSAAVNSPERGVELATYYAITGDSDKGREAIAWTLQQPCETLDVQMVRSATEDLQSAQDAVRLSGLVCQDAPHSLAKFGLPDPAIKGDAFLLSFRPQELERPSWKQHVAGLALVNLDPNSRAAQFIQGWAMEDRFTIREGPGVVYEFLWANPYLPGVGYQNMPPWMYEAGSLFARTDWTANACWIHVSDSGKQQEQCPGNVFTHTLALADLLILPVEERCVALPKEDTRVTILLSNLTPGRKVLYTSDREKRTEHADDAGLWRVPVGVAGNVCTPK